MTVALSFTGSNEVGGRLYADGAKLGKKVQCEMGGKNALVLLEDGDLELAAQATVSGAFGSTGQRCTATSRAVVDKKLVEPFTRRVVELARQTGACQVSFLAVDVANPHAFGRVDGSAPDLALRREDLRDFERLLSRMEREHAADFRSGFIAESPRRLRRIHQYFCALCGEGAFPPVRCNAPEFSAVIGANGQVNPCFFIAGPAAAGRPDDLQAALNGDSMRALRAEIRAGARPECATCVCSLWREPGSRTAAGLLLARKADA